MKVTYFVCAQVDVHNTKAGKTTKELVNKLVTIEHKDTETMGSIAKKLYNTIPECNAIINFWEYKR
jgi:hypothetical protein